MQVLAYGILRGDCWARCMVIVSGLGVNHGTVLGAWTAFRPRRIDSFMRDLFVT